MLTPLIPASAFGAPRRALLKVFVHAYDRTPITSLDVDGDERAVLGTTTSGVVCRYEAAGQTTRDATGLVNVSGPSLTVTHDDPGRVR